MILRRHRTVPGRPGHLVWNVLWVLATLGAVEVMSYAAIAATRRSLINPIQTTDAIYEAQTEAIRRVLDPPPEDMFVVDSILGWSWRPGFQDDRTAINSQGLRSRVEHSPEPPEGRTRLAIFGNSFVYGADVPMDSSWVALLEAAWPDLEVMNYGGAAYGIDQNYIHYMTHARRYGPRVVVIGVAPDNVRRNVNVYRRFLTPRGPPHSKPRFRLADDGTLVLEPNPIRTLGDLERYIHDPAGIRELGRRDRWYEPLIYETPLYDRSAAVRLGVHAWIRVRNRYFDSDRLYDGEVFNTESKAFALEMALLRAFRTTVAQDGALPVIVFFPDRFSVALTVAGERPSYAPVREALDAEGVPYLDLTEPLLGGDPSRDLSTVFMPGLHYTPDASRRVGEWLGERIQERLAGAGGPS